ncbi:competence transcription factor ComK [Staphylococcus pasteuri]
MTTQSIYVIRKGDMVIRPNYDENNQQNGSEILRYDKSIIQSPFKVQKIIERSCKFYGNNYLSKKAETNRITGISSKPPILLTPIFPTYFFQHILTGKKKIYGLTCIMLNQLKN